MYAKCKTTSTWTAQIVILWVVATLLLMRGICGVLSSYSSTMYIYSCASGPACHLRP